MLGHFKAMSWKIWGVVKEPFIVLDMKDPTPWEKENLQLNDQALNVIYEALHPKVFELVKDLDMAHKVWKRLNDASRHNLWPVKWNALQVIPLSCTFHSISSNVDATQAPTIITKWYDPLYIIMRPYWFIDPNLASSSSLPLCINAKSLLKLLYHVWSVTPKPLTCPSHL